MRAVQVVSSLANEAAGPSYSVRRLGESLSAFGIHSTTYATGPDKTLASCGTTVRTFKTEFDAVPVLRALHMSNGLLDALVQAASDGSVLHSHGLWLMPNLYPAWAIRQSRGVLIVSPRGMLAPAALQFSRWKKRAFWALLQKRALESATCFHATSQQEADEIRDMGLKAPIAIVPNGIDLPPAEDVGSGRANATCRRTVLHLGRLHPKKGGDRLIAAWARVEGDNPDWQLRIVGPSEGGYADALMSQAARLRLQRVAFETPLFGAAKEAAYRQADLFVLPTQNENFGIVVAEALANGTPVICSKGAPWAGLETHGCGWWIDHGVDALTAALRLAMATPKSELAVMGDRGRAWMAADFSWGRVAEQLASVYRWCSNKSDKPSFVVLE
jgi:glycosyltransferase involved in cell wall biosynthesis